MTTLLAVASTDAMLSALLWVVIVGLVAWLLWWLIGYMGLPEPFNKVARVLVAVGAVIILIKVLIGLVD